MTTRRDAPTLNFCAGRGALGASGEAAPASPAVYQHGGLRRGVLCSNLRCVACGVALRWRDGLQVVGGTAVLPAAFAAGDPAAAEGVARGLASHRLYLCRCAYYSCGGEISLAVGREIPRLGLPPPWGCAGHPPATLPITVGGVEIRDDVDWWALMEGAFSDPAAEGDPLYWTRWARQVYGDVANTPHQARLDDALAALLGAADGGGPRPGRRLPLVPPPPAGDRRAARDAARRRRRPARPAGHPAHPRPLRPRRPRHLLPPGVQAMALRGRSPGRPPRARRGARPPGRGRERARVE